MGKERKRDHGIRAVLSVIVHNWSTLLCFELIYKIVGFSFFFPFLGFLSRQLPGIINESYLSQENFNRLLVNPIAILILICIAVLLGGYLYFEIVALVLYSEAGWKREGITFWQMVYRAFVKVLEMFRIKRFAVFFMLPVMPLSFFGAASVFLRTVEIPEFILTAITDSTLYICMLVVAVVLVNYLSFLYLFGFPSLLLTDMSFCDSWKESFRLLKRKKIRTCRKILGYTFIFALVLCVGWMSIVGGIAGIVRISDGADVRRESFRMYFDTFTGVWNLLSGVLVSAFLCAVIVVLYHANREESRPGKTKSREWTVKRAIISVVVSIVLGISLVFMGDTEIGRQFFHTEHLNPVVIAHRAGVTFGPENTVAALNQAVKDGADMAEIDVQQLKDGTLVVLHDTNFMRTTGVKLNVWDAEYEQVKGMDAGSFRSREYAGEPVPTLEEMLEAAKGKVQLMIELKATGREQSLVEDTITLIKEYGMEEQCNIASLDLELLKQAKKLDPEIKTTYISVLLVSKSYDLKQIDSYSVETSFLSRELVYQAHMQGKKVYGWTASTDENIKKVLSSEADGIVTDNPELVRYHIGMLGKTAIEETVEEIFF